MSLVLLAIYFELFPILLLLKKNVHILKKVTVIIIYNYLIIKLVAPPNSYTLEEWGWNETVIKCLYVACNWLKYIIPTLLILLNLPIKFRR
jgi:hypothetical protein